MTNEAKTVQAEYMRKWRQKNTDKIQEYNRRYWEKKAAQAREAQTDAVNDGGGEADATVEIKP